LRTKKVVTAMSKAEKGREAEGGKPQGPTARSCPLVLDGEIDARDFSPADCVTCDEFDCPFCEAAHGSGALRSRLFASDGADDDMDDDLWGDDEMAFGADEEEEDESDADDDFF